MIYCEMGAQDVPVAIAPGAPPKPWTSGISHDAAKRVYLHVYRYSITAPVDTHSTVHLARHTQLDTN